ncbi:MAG: 50S ribosomal protein L13 [Thermoplasmatales archaeon]|nr:MAG: 50S ribosomal protein L13 [Thermoplasmatales archaeon]
MVTVIDADGAILGRMCTAVAKRLLNEEIIAVVNSEKAIISGKKSSIKNRYKHKRKLGTYRKGPFFPRMPDRLVKRTVRGMIPYQTPHGRAAFKKLKCYIGVPKEFEGMNFEKIGVAEKQPIEYITVEELSKSLGAKC